jgi:predicted XRE-type DNA-binding protein
MNERPTGQSIPQRSATLSTLSAHFRRSLKMVFERHSVIWRSSRSDLRRQKHIMSVSTKKAVRARPPRAKISAARQTRAKITRGSNNVFADLGFTASERELGKAKLVVLIKDRLRELGITQIVAAHRMGISQPKISKLLRGDTSGTSTGWLMTALLNLGRDVEIRVKPARTRTGRLYVFAC